MTETISSNIAENAAGQSFTARVNMRDEPSLQAKTAARHRAHRSRCLVCRSDERWRIELLKAGGASSEALSRRFGMSADSIDRHWKAHVSKETKLTHLAGFGSLGELAEKAAESGLAVIDYLALVRNVQLAQIDTANAAGDTRMVLAATGHLTRTLEATAKISGELVTATGSVTINNVNVMHHPEVERLQRAILQAIRPYPEAVQAVMAALEDLENNAPAGPVGPANKLLELEANP